jgi:hypothetical protein
MFQSFKYIPIEQVTFVPLFNQFIETKSTEHILLRFREYQIKTRKNVFPERGSSSQGIIF